jgi:histidine ammonia-lyase
MIQVAKNIAHYRAVSLSEAGDQSNKHSLQSPDCSRFAPLVWGYVKVSLSEAVNNINLEI